MSAFQRQQLVNACMCNEIQRFRRALKQGVLSPHKKLRLLDDIRMLEGAQGTNNLEKWMEGCIDRCLEVNGGGGGDSGESKMTGIEASSSFRGMCEELLGIKKEVNLPTQNVEEEDDDDDGNDIDHEGDGDDAPLDIDFIDRRIIEQLVVDLLPPPLNLFVDKFGRNTPPSQKEGKRDTKKPVSMMMKVAVGLCLFALAGGMGTYVLQTGMNYGNNFAYGWMSGVGQVSAYVL